jgi:localization factor PodJL
MSSSDQAMAQPAIQPSDALSLACAAAGLEEALQRLAGQIGEADRRHCGAITDMQGRLRQLGRQVEQIRTDLPQEHAGALCRLEQEIVGLTERIAAFGHERQAQKARRTGHPHMPTGGGEPCEEPWDKLWDAQSAEALTRICEMAHAESPANRRPSNRANSDKPRWQTHARPSPPPAPTLAYDEAWLEARFAGIAAQLQQSLAESNPAKPLAALDRRLARLEDRLETLFAEMSVRLGGEWLELIEEHIRGLAGHFEATSRQLARLDAFDEQLRELSRANSEQLQWSRSQSAGLRVDTIAALIDSAAERTASRLAAAWPAAAAAIPEGDGTRIDALEVLMQDYIAERRRGEETTAGTLRTIEEALARVLDRVSAMETAGAAAFAAGFDDAAGRDGFDAESDRLAEAYATGARILGQTPSAPTLDAADYARPVAHREENLQPASGGLGHAAVPEDTRPGRELGAADTRAALNIDTVSAEPETVTRNPTRDDTPADLANRTNARTLARMRRPWSGVLFGSAILLLFGLGYLAVALFTASGAAPTLQQKLPAPTTQDQPAPDPAQLKAEQAMPDPQPSPPTAKPDNTPPIPDDKTESLPVPVPVPAKRPTRDLENEDRAQADLPRHPAAASQRALPRPLAAPPSIGTTASRSAADMGDPLAQFEMAVRHAEGSDGPQDHRLALVWYERAAMRGLARAQFHVATYYEHGIGVDVDTERAKIWYRRAAEQGHVPSMHNLAVLLVGGRKTDADYAAAAPWFQKAADRGLADSQFNLGMLYAHGRGVRKDLIEAYKWFGLAARSGDAEAIRKLEETKAQLEAPEREAAQHRLATWRASAGEPAAR